MDERSLARIIRPGGLPAAPLAKRAKTVYKYRYGGPNDRRTHPQAAENSQLRPQSHPEDRLPAYPDRDLEGIPLQLTQRRRRASADAGEERRDRADPGRLARHPSYRGARVAAYRPRRRGEPTPRRGARRAAL